MINTLFNLVEKNEWLEKYLKIVAEDTNEPVYHVHHIIPRAYYRHFNIPVDNSRDNLVRLTPEQHVLAHYYLAQCSSESWFKKVNYSSVLYMCKLKKSELTEDAVRESAAQYGKCITGINNPCHREVYQYSLSGELIKKWDTVVEAAKFLGISENHISSCCYNKKRKSCGGYMWSYKNNIRNAYSNERKVKVYQYDLEGKFISEYDGVREAARATGVKNSCSISACCRGTRNQCKNFLWSYEKCDIIKYKRGITTKRRVANIDSEGNIIKIFDSISEASKETGAKNIYVCCSGKRKSSNGLRWIFIDE